MNFKEKLQQLAQERQNLQVAIIDITGAMKILEQQILEIQETSEASQPSNTEASTPQEEVVPSE